MQQLRTLLCASALLSLLSSTALAQTAATGNIEGIVADASGGVLPGVPVVIRNQDTNVVRESTTDDAGRYRAPALQPGVYEVSATLTRLHGEAGGRTFGSRSGRPCRSTSGCSRPASTETISVIAEAPLIDMRRTDVSSSSTKDVHRQPPDQRPALGHVRAC